MSGPVLILSALALFFVGTVCGDPYQIIHPTYRPPPRRNPIIRTAREAETPREIAMTTVNDDLDPNVPHLDRYLRSLSTPTSSRGSDSGSRGSKGHDTEATHPGPAYNRRNAREAIDEPTDVIKPIGYPSSFPTVYNEERFDPSVPHYGRIARSLSTPGRGRTSGTTRGSGGHDTGPTHPGYNRRNARSLTFPGNPDFSPRRPQPRFPTFPVPAPRPRFPIYV